MTPHQSRTQRKANKRQVEKNMLAYAKRVVLLDKSIEKVKKELEDTDANNTEMITELNTKLARLQIQAGKVGMAYDSMVAAHNELSRMSGKNQGVIQALERSIIHNADTSYRPQP